MNSIPSLLVLFALIVSSTARGVESLQLAAVLGDNMVLQREVRVPIWGLAPPGEKVKIEFAGQSMTGIADSLGRWRVDLEPMEPSWEGRTLLIDGGERLEVRNILVGDVWLCGGQSNMQMGLARTEDGEEAVAEANHPAIRLFNVGNHIVERGRDLTGQWAECSPASVGRFSGVGYYFGRKLHQRLEVPIGLINSSWGSTQAEGWTPVEALAEVEELRGFLARDAARERDRPARQADHDALVAQWREVSAGAVADGQAPPPPPRLPHVLRPQSMAGSLYDSMIHPLIPFAIRGIIWYQGEGNLGRADQYRVLLPTLIHSWREGWGQGEIPFGIVQLPNHNPVAVEPGDSIWARLREAQWATHRAISGTGLAVTIDIGKVEGGHPRNKRDVGHRLARWALADVYGVSIPRSGPVFGSFSIDGQTVTIFFAESGHGLRTLDGAAPRGFALAGADRRWHPAEATISGAGQVEVRSAAVSRPAAVRYAWADNPGSVNLTNQTGLPASPFRTDDWPWGGD